MRITNTLLPNYTTQNANNARKDVSFRHSLGYYIKKVPMTEIENKLFDLGVQELNLFNKKTIAACCYKTAKIFHQLGLAVPKKISVCKLEDDSAGAAAWDEEEGLFCDEKYNKNRFSIIKNNITAKLYFFHPSFNLFSTFIHEFAHNAHNANLRKIYGEKFFEIKNALKNTNEITNNAVAYALGTYSVTNANEFVAESLTKQIINCLDDEYNLIKDPFKDSYDDWSLSELTLNIAGGIISKRIRNHIFNSKEARAILFLKYWNGDIFETEYEKAVKQADKEMRKSLEKQLKINNEENQNRLKIYDDISEINEPFISINNEQLKKHDIKIKEGSENLKLKLNKELKNIQEMNKNGKSNSTQEIIEYLEKDIQELNSKNNFKQKMIEDLKKIKNENENQIGVNNENEY